ncbi:MerR family DNA-binding transcriptional regulator [Clostridium sp. C2-6-12]|uniref:MerR family DNA-binding transcriptional regulator n=1 Tax=Clostridium sp. C2-6-12 TaxID=2698832 RepID=UPI00136B29E9|nr:MerR family DNA-binding transcriptional regulator [Clostridium sp. C2-6-12]
MKKRNYIGKISEVLKIPSSTLRYWEDQSLVEFPRDKDNNYRSISLKTILRIWDIILYRNLNIPLKQIKLMRQMNIDELEFIIGQNRKKLIEELASLEKAVKKIETKEKSIEKIKYYKSNPCYIEKYIFPPIKLFNYSKNYLSKEMTQFYISDVDDFVIVIDSEKSIADYGMFVSEEEEKNIFRDKDSCEKLYLKGLLKVDGDDINNKNNCNELILNAEKLGYKTGTIIGKYLISACEDKRYDYYEAWVELL